MSACESLQTAARLGGRGSFAMWCRDSLRSWTCSDARGRTRSTSGTSSLSRWRTHARLGSARGGSSLSPAGNWNRLHWTAGEWTAGGGRSGPRRAGRRAPTADGRRRRGGRKTDYLLVCCCFSVYIISSAPRCLVGCHNLWLLGSAGLIHDRACQCASRPSMQFALFSSFGRVLCVWI